MRTTHHSATMPGFRWVAMSHTTPSNPCMIRCILLLAAAASASRILKEATCHSYRTQVSIPFSGCIIPTLIESLLFGRLCTPTPGSHRKQLHWHHIRRPKERYRTPPRHLRHSLLLQMAFSGRPTQFEIILSSGIHTPS